METDLSQYLPDLVRIARQAGEGILDIYQRSRQFKVKSKEDHSPLTQADLVANEIITRGLQRLAPQWPILSEESVLVDFSERQHWSRYWLVDPLDGTREFIRHSGDFAVNIALIEKHQPVLGIIHVPVTNITYYASQGGGAYQRALENKAVAIKARRWQRNQTIILTSRGFKPEQLEQQFAAIGKYELKPMGSAIKFAKIAVGEADFYPRLGDTCEWDTASGQCILEEVGGAIVDLQGQPLRYNDKDSLINPHFIAVGDLSLIKQLRKRGK